LGSSFEQEDQNKEIVIKDLCIGCGKCSNICPKDDIISYRHNSKELEKLLPVCLEKGAECFELHAAVGDEEVTIKEWELLNKINSENFNSMCLDRLNLGNLNLEKRIENAKDISKGKLIIQADGYPMSGGQDNYNSTLQAVACADVINKKFNMLIKKKKDLVSLGRAKNTSQKKYRPHHHSKNVFIVLSGGTNSLSKKMANLSGVRCNGVAIGTFARDIVEKYTSKKDFYTNIENIKDAVEVAKELVDNNLEVFNG
jgi:ferredoxin